MFESCLEIRAHFWDYVDGTCERSVFSSIRYHLDYCSACRQELERMEMISSDLKSLPARRVPPELALRLRVKLSQHIHHNVVGRLLVSLDNAFRPLLLPASGGFVAAIVCFALIVGSQLSPSTGLASVDTQLNKPPRIEQLAPMNFPLQDEGIVVMTNIDAEGRVLSYQIISGSASNAELHNLDRMMFFSHFQPAMLDGKPTDGQVVLSLRRITVRG